MAMSKDLLLGGNGKVLNVQFFLFSQVHGLDPRKNCLKTNKQALQFHNASYFFKTIISRNVKNYYLNKDCV